MVLIMILVPSAVACGMVNIVEPGAISLPAFLTGVGMLALNVFFYLCLTLMIGMLVNSREIALGVSMGTLLLGLIARNFIGPADLLTPWLISDLAGVVAMGEPLGVEMWLSIISTAIWSLLFIFVALWRFRRFEF
jgi:ABC-type transport system involved in multi-copper enzyme maturation permease subunit